EIVLDARTVSFARYTRFGLPRPRWRLGVDLGGERGALAEPQAAIDVPIVPEQPQPTQITARVHVAGVKRLLAVRANRKKPGQRIALEHGRQTIAFQVEPGWLVPGENLIAFDTQGKG